MNRNLNMTIIKLMVINCLTLCLLGCASQSALDTPKLSDSGTKKVKGIISDSYSLNSSRRVDRSSGIPVAELVESIVGLNYSGHPIYLVKIDESITLEVASNDAFKIGDCVLVWYDEGMGDSPNLSMLGQAGMSKSAGCNK